MSDSDLVLRISQSTPIHLLRDPDHAARDLARRWSERQRFWHGQAHLLALFAHFDDHESDGERRDTLQLAALYHDAVYDPLRADNEDASARLLLGDASDPAHPVVRRAAEIVLASKWSEAPADPLTRRFWEADCHPLSAGVSLAERLVYERANFREYQFAPWSVYREKRADFLHAWAARFPEHRAGVAECLDLLAGMTPRVAIYPGSFHPFHRGHLSILRQAENLFDKVIVGLAVNRQKSGAGQNLDDRLAAARDRLAFHEVTGIPGLLTDYLESHPLPLAVVRGVRDGTDMEAELRFSRFLNDLRPGTQLVWIACGAELQHLSSSAIRELESIAPGAGAAYVPGKAEIYGWS